MNKPENAALPPWGEGCKVSYREGYRSNMVDFHSHDYYEISLIISGNVKSLLQDRAESGSQSRLVLTAPHTPHFIFLETPSFYSRINMCFSDTFITDYVPEWSSLVKVFGRNGNIILLSDEQRALCRELLTKLGGEKNLFRQRLRILEFLSLISEFAPRVSTVGDNEPPAYVLQALSYVSTHYAERIVAAELAWRLSIGRTTLMTAFRKHTGTTLTQYVTRVRTKEAVRLLRQGLPREDVAERVGLGDGSGMIRAFRSCYGMTPSQYLKLIDQSKGD